MQKDLVTTVAIAICKADWRSEHGQTLDHAEAVEMAYAYKAAARAAIRAIKRHQN